MSDVRQLTEEEWTKFSERPTLLAAAQRCNRYNAYDYTPMYIAGAKVIIALGNAFIGWFIMLCCRQTVRRS